MLPTYSGRPSTTITSLSSLPVARSLVSSPGRTAKLTRASNMEAALVQSTGQVQLVPCAHCGRGYGPWSGCVAAAGFLTGSCANCHYGSEGSRCSLRTYSAPRHMSSLILTDRQGPRATAASVAAAVAAAGLPPVLPPAPPTTPASASRPVRRMAPTPVIPARPSGGGAAARRRLASACK